MVKLTEFGPEPPDKAGNSKLYVGSQRRDGKFPVMYVFPSSGRKINSVISSEQLEKEKAEKKHDIIYRENVESIVARLISENEDDEPEEGDIATEDHQHWYMDGKLYHTGDAKSLKAKMDKDGWFPNVFFISDHGNAHLISGRPGWWK